MTYTNGGPPNRGVDQLLERNRAHGRPLPNFAPRRDGRLRRTALDRLMRANPYRSSKPALRGADVHHEDLDAFGKVINVPELAPHITGGRGTDELARFATAQGKRLSRTMAARLGAFMREIGGLAEHGLIEMGHEEMARKVGITTRSVTRYVDALMKLGVIERAAPPVRERWTGSYAVTDAFRKSVHP